MRLRAAERRPCERHERASIVSPAIRELRGRSRQLDAVTASMPRTIRARPRRTAKPPSDVDRASPAQQPGPSEPPPSAVHVARTADGADEKDLDGHEDGDDDFNDNSEPLPPSDLPKDPRPTWAVDRTELRALLGDKVTLRRLKRHLGAKYRDSR